MAITIGRRRFITLLGGAAAWPLAGQAQQAALPVVGWLGAGAPSAKAYVAEVIAFQQGLQDAGYREGQNVTIEYRWAEDHYDRLPALATDLIQRGVTVIAAGPRAVNAAKALTATIPIVFFSGADPVRLGLVTSLSRPGANLTGITILAGDLNAKRFRLFHDLVPQAAVIGVLWDTTNATSPDPDFATREVQEAARSIGVPIRVIGAGTEIEIEAAFATFAREGAGAVFVVNGFFLFSLSDRLVALAALHRMPLSGELRTFVMAGGLMSYGPNDIDAWRQVGVYTGRILKGEKPADLPVLQPTTFEFVLNLKTAKTLGLTIPPSVLAISDEVIE